ncbi:MAG TPA: DUF433 domain-containing protein [Bryobacteraceae bacterium]|nr:DUF433 domain-containing protein [Bryobacteraceae bacterium]
MIVGLVAAGYSIPEILTAYPYLEQADIRQALAYGATFAYIDSTGRRIFTY